MEVAAIVSLRSFHNRYVVYSVQEVVVEAATVHSQILFSFSGLVSNLLDEVSENHIFWDQSDTPWAAAAAAAVVVVVVETEQLVL